LGGAQLTATGEQVLRIYRAIERECQRAVDKRGGAGGLAWRGMTDGDQAFALWTCFIWRDVDLVDGRCGSNVLHLILLPFREAGHHLLFPWFAEVVMILGGTTGRTLAACS
jgi:hypothetical protein